MSVIRLMTEIEAPIEACFDAARDIDLHLASSAIFQERAVAGVTSGLIGPGESVTWEARHLGRRWRMTTRITAFEPPTFFQDTMQQGPFAAMQHDHRFVALGPRRTRMTDEMRFRAPLGPLGWVAEALVLRRHLTRFLEHRNAVLASQVEAR